VDERMRDYRTRIDSALEQADPITAALLSDLYQDLKGLAEENNKLRQSLVKSAQKSNSMSSKLKDALYE
jgi:hypothetical protein